jgi:hypothetical protein
MIVPVVYDERSEQRNTIMFATSSTVARRPNGKPVVNSRQRSALPSSFSARARQRTI